MPVSKCPQLLDLTETGYVVTNSRGFVLDANRTYVNLSGHDALEQIKGRSIVEWTSPAHHDRTLQAIEHGLATGSIRQVEVDYVTAEGKTTPVELNATTFHSADGVGLIALCRDISKRREAQEANQRQQTELARLARLNTMGQLATGLAHELNQPLAAILNYAGVCRDLIERLPGTSERSLMSRAMDGILTETQRAGEIIGRLRAQMKKHEPFRRPIELTQEVADVVSMLAFEFRASHIDVESNLRRKLVVSADPIEIQQVCTNLLRNAIDAVSGLVHQRAITIECESDNGRAVIAITDNGPGIPPDRRDKVFEPFYTTKADGLGMGLAICRSIIQNHGGELTVRSDPGRTTFSFSLPLLYGNKSCSYPPRLSKPLLLPSMS